MKSVLISIQPKWCELIAIGKKIIEVRKTKPRIYTPFKCYIYCTKGGLNIYSNGKQYVTDSFEILKNGADEAFEETSTFRKWNGKVIGEFICDKIRPIAILAHIMVRTVDCMQSCLSACEILEYADGKPVYGWHISNLKIYDKPKELSEFRKYISFYDDISLSELENSGISNLRIKRPPQDWRYVEGARI